MSKIVILPPMEGNESLDYAPLSTPAAVTPQPDAPNVDACGVRLTHGPNRNFEDVEAGGEDSCLTGVGVEYSEFFLSLYKLQESGSEQPRGESHTKGAAGGGTLSLSVSAFCNPPHVNFRWKALAFAASEVNGVLYGGDAVNYEGLACN